jgi:hypothetical protein
MSGLNGHGSAIYENTPCHIGMSPASASEAALRAEAPAAQVGQPWFWTLTFGQHEDRTPTHGYEPTREAAMAVFAKSWRLRKRTGLPA